MQRVALIRGGGNFHLSLLLLCCLEYGVIVGGLGSARGGLPGGDPTPLHLRHHSQNDSSGE